MYKYIDPDEANKLFNFILSERSNGKNAVEKELIKKAKIVKDLEEALAKINSNAHKGLQLVKKGSSMEAYYDGQLSIIALVTYIIDKGEHDIFKYSISRLTKYIKQQIHVLEGICYVKRKDSTDY